MKKRIFKIAMIAFIIINMFSIIAFASQDNTSVRIRIRSGRKYDEQVDLKGYGNINIYDYNVSSYTPLAILDENVDVLLDTYYNEKYLAQGMPNNSTIIGPYHIAINGYSFNDYNTALSSSNNFSSTYGIDFYPFYNGQVFLIYGGVYIDEASARVGGESLDLDGISYDIVNGKGKFISVYNVYNKIVMMYENNFNMYFSSYNHNLKCQGIDIDKKAYRGLIGFYADNNKLISINNVFLDQYLYGVISNEIGSTWHIEAVKAQVLAARTYAVSNIKKNPTKGYDMEDNQNSQVYNGVISEKARINQAVDETSGEMIYYEGKLISAFYHSTSGGRTENSENIWVNSIPYLRAVDDPYSNISPVAKWSVPVSRLDLIKKINSKGYGISDIYGINTAEISENGRVMKCIISTDKGDITFEKDEIRNLLGYSVIRSIWYTVSTEGNIYLIGPSKTNEKGYKYDDIQNASISGLNVISSSGLGTLDSSNINCISKNGVEKVSFQKDSFYFNGLGYGHGVGMSQYGAKEMAENGFTYIEILKHYYTGVEIK